MKNEPKKWEEQKWTIPKNMLSLVRKGENWYIEISGSYLLIPLPDDFSIGLEGFAERIERHHAMEDWIDRQSIQFRWLRFRYRWKQRREAKKNTKGPPDELR